MISGRICARPAGAHDPVPWLGLARGESTVATHPLPWIRVPSRERVITVLFAPITRTRAALSSRHTHTRGVVLRVPAFPPAAARPPRSLAATTSSTRAPSAPHPRSPPEHPSHTAPRPRLLGSPISHCTASHSPPFTLTHLHPPSRIVFHYPWRPPSSPLAHPPRDDSTLLSTPSPPPLRTNTTLRSSPPFFPHPCIAPSHSLRSPFSPLPLPLPLPPPPGSIRSSR